MFSLFKLKLSLSKIFKFKDSFLFLNVVLFEDYFKFLVFLLSIDIFVKLSTIQFNKFLILLCFALLSIFLSFEILIEELLLTMLFFKKSFIVDSIFWYTKSNDKSFSEIIPFIRNNIKSTIFLYLSFFSDVPYNSETALIKIF
mgnify:CR=1 FL=1